MPSYTCPVRVKAATKDGGVQMLQDVIAFAGMSGRCSPTNGGDGGEAGERKLDWRGWLLKAIGDRGILNNYKKPLCDSLAILELACICTSCALCQLSLTSPAAVNTSCDRLHADFLSAALKRGAIYGLFHLKCN